MVFTMEDIITKTSEDLKFILMSLLQWQKAALRDVCPFGFACHVCEDMFPELDDVHHDCPCTEFGGKVARLRLKTIIKDFSPIEVFACFSYESRVQIAKSHGFISQMNFDPSEWRARKSTGSGVEHYETI